MMDLLSSVNFNPIKEVSKDPFTDVFINRELNRYSKFAFIKQDPYKIGRAHV